MSYIQLKSMKKKEGLSFPVTWSKAYYKDENVSIYLNEPWKESHLITERGKETTGKTEDYFYPFLYFLRHLDTKVITKM